MRDSRIQPFAVTQSVPDPTGSEAGLAEVSPVRRMRFAYPPYKPTSLLKEDTGSGCGGRGPPYDRGLGTHRLREFLSLPRHDQATSEDTQLLFGVTSPSSCSQHVVRPAPDKAAGPDPTP